MISYNRIAYMNTVVMFSNVNVSCGVLRTSLCDPSQSVTSIYIYIYIHTHELIRNTKND